MLAGERWCWQESILGKGTMCTKAKAWQCEGKCHTQGIVVRKWTGRTEETVRRWHRLGIVIARAAFGRSCQDNSWIWGLRVWMSGGKDNKEKRFWMREWSWWVPRLDESCLRFSWCTQANTSGRQLEILTEGSGQRSSQTIHLRFTCGWVTEALGEDKFAQEACINRQWLKVEALKNKRKQAKQLEGVGRPRSEEWERVACKGGEGGKSEADAEGSHQVC